MRPIAPDDWSPRQALAVLDFLEELHQAIWNQYEAAVVPLYIEQLRQSREVENEIDDDFDDEISF